MNGPLLESLRGGLIVSCQAYPGDPMRRPGLMALVAQSVERGGAVAVRLEGLSDVRDGVSALKIPVIGIVKRGPGSVQITPTLHDCLDLAHAGARIVAVDGTRRVRPDGLTLGEVVQGVRASSDALIMADCGSLEDARFAADAGVDLVGTTLAGYTGERKAGDGPDIGLVGEVSSRLPVPVIAEGRYWTPEQARSAIEAGAFAVCVGSAITHPERLTIRFMRGLVL